MRPEQWESFKRAAKSRRADRLPVSLIIDSSSIPGYLGIRHTDYYFDPEVWFQANLRVAEEFPEIIVFPSWSAGYGMAIEPSAFGCKIRFFADQPPAQLPTLSRLEDVDHLSPVDPRTDGLMPAALHRYQSQRTGIIDSRATGFMPISCDSCSVEGRPHQAIRARVNGREVVHILQIEITRGARRKLQVREEADLAAEGGTRFNRHAIFRPPTGR